MIVVSDTSPLTALLSIGRSELLQSLFGQVLIPPAVAAELQRSHTEFPGFIRVQPTIDQALVARLRGHLDTGEAEAIALARETHADYLLMDEIAGRESARQQGLRVIGVLGVLLEAKRHRLIHSVADVLDQLEAQTTFFIAADLKARVLKEAGEG